MPDVQAVLEQCRWLISKGRGNEKAHLLLVEAEEKKRIENTGPKPRTKFVIETDSPEAYAEMHKCKDFVIKHCKNKAVAITMLLWAWRQLDAATLDKLMAAGEGPDA
jgi:hypothetical protein